jgi:hypothetical protein
MRKTFLKIFAVGRRKLDRALYVLKDGLQLILKLAW